ncbi:MAG: hypothetical protein KQH53_05610 [Desulfarculaceae bacterium]|nr:hypothetical protein [Desulfarculaceae bacterium]
MPGTSQQATVMPEDASRPRPGRKLLAVLAAIAALRLLLGLGLYWTAPGPSPTEQLYQVSERLLAPDAPRFYAAALHIDRFWSGRLGHCEPGLTPEYLGYPALLASLFQLTGAGVWPGLALNALAWFLASLLAFYLAVRLGRGQAACAWAALLVALWPPALAYNAVLIKDSVFLCLLMGIMLCLVAVASPRRPRDSWLAAAWLLPLAWVAMTVRFDFSTLGLVVAGAAGVLGLAGAVFRWRLLTAAGVVAACLAVFFASWLATRCALGPALIHEQQLHTPPVTSLAEPVAPAARPAWRAAAPTEQPGPVIQSAREAWRYLWGKRWLYAANGTASAPPETMLIVDSPSSLARLAAASLRDLFLFPYPWQRWPSSGGAISKIISAQSLFWYALLPGLVLGLVRLLRRRPRAALLLLFWSLGVGGLLALVVVNLGSLYRMRDMIILPLLATVSLRPYAALWRWVRWGKAGRS